MEMSEIRKIVQILPEYLAMVFPPERIILATTHRVQEMSSNLFFIYLSKNEAYSSQEYFFIHRSYSSEI